ncbi:hypothetical protein LOZ51_000023 [Ophidiomyces ophidiicola]|nr:hypothetical protein LOZ54_003754 [Ophidiomyces ophidiicola]KAI2002951.1 hypothetical protein LOZ51_000023 [Ophidiomyces ophidiicola]
MPIKFPKGFARRKSSGNALEEVQAPVEPSFRVFERPQGGSKSFDGTTALNRLSGPQRNASLDDPYPDNIFAGIERPPSVHHYAQENHPPRPRAGKLTGSTGSGGTNNSSSPGRLYDSSSSAKFSSSSTLPSDNSAHDIPIPPIPESSFASAWRAAGRTFSFGGRPPKIVPPNPSTPRQSQSTTRERALTGSTNSTATPPRLLDSDLNLDMSDDFSNIFEGFEKRKSQTTLDSKPSPTSAPRQLTPLERPEVPRKGKQGDNAALLSPIRTNQPTTAVPEPSPSNSQTSADRLISSGSPERPQSSRLVQQFNKLRFSEDDSRNAANSSRNLTASSSTSQDHNSLSSSNATLMPDRPPMPTVTIERPHPDPEVSSMYGSDKDFTTVPLNSRSRKPMSAESSIKPVNSSYNDNSLTVEASLAARYEEVAMKNDEKPNKIMTPAQFERYRQQQELMRRPSNASSIFSDNHSEEEEEEEEEDDEAEKKRKAANQRKKQEAHLSVYRQQMMKITGEQMKLPNLEAKRESLDAATPAPAGNVNRQSILMPETSPGAQSTGADEDDEVPLAILAAHGFPNRNRPPSQLLSSSSNPNLRSSFLHTPPSVAGDTPLPKRKTLPVFARNLPQDPYYGAGLVNQTKRESLAMGGGSPSVYGGSAPNLPPGGLVGVIANEERARAMRRGSPNAQATFDMPNATPGVNSAPGQGGLISQIGGVPIPGPQMPMVPGDQNQIQVSQQMTQMMQMQIQWMQQMMQMQSMQLGQPMLANNPNLLQPPSGAMPRPISMLSNFNTFPSAAPQADQRTMSMLDPSMGQWNRRSSFFPSPQDMGASGNMGNGAAMGAPGYAPSVAPSERSNVGTASRYRPVSTIQPLQNRSSTFTSSTPRPWLNEARHSSFISPSPQARQQPLNSTIRPVSGLVSSAKNANEDDDDEKGWAEMAKAREKNKSGWRFKKGSSSLGDLFHTNKF